MIVTDGIIIRLAIYRGGTGKLGFQVPLIVVLTVDRQWFKNVCSLSQKP